MGISLASLPLAYDGVALVLNTEPQVCTEIEGPSWAATCTVGAYEGPDVWVIESVLITDGMPVLAANPILGVYAVDSSSSRSIAVSGGKVCSSEELAEPDGMWPAGIWIRYDA